MKARVSPVGPIMVMGCPAKAAYTIPLTPHDMTYSITPSCPCVTYTTKEAVL